MSETFYRHPQALVESQDVGRGTRVWAFAHILPGAHVGEDCNVCDHTFIEGGARIGNRVTLKCGVQVWDGIHIEDDVFVGPNATFTNDRTPRSRQWPSEFPTTRVGRGASIGANATLLPGVSIGEYAMIAAGAVVSSDVPPYATVMGNPARIRGYVGKDGARIEPIPISSARTELRVAGVRVIEPPRAPEVSGLAVRDGWPFPVRMSRLLRGRRGLAMGRAGAMRRTARVLLASSGASVAWLDDASTQQAILLDAPTLALQVEPMVWTSLHSVAKGTLLELSSEDDGDALEDYTVFKAHVPRSG